MMWPTSLRRPLLAFIAILIGHSPVRAQPPGPASSCNYARCALGIVPAWNGLLITRGASHERVANLGFFWAGSLDHVFAGSDSAVAYGRRAVRTRRAAAALTDLGALALGVASIRGLANGRLSTGDRAAAVAGAAAFAVSVPLQFAADGQLSRAIWWRNTLYAK